MEVKISAEEREELKRQLDALDAADAKISDAMKPFRAALDAVEDLRQGLLDKYENEIRGKCETCDCLIFFGELGYSYADGEPITCAEHAPTWADVKRMAEENPEGFEEPEDAAVVIEQCRQRELNGTLHEKVLHEL